MRADLRSLLDSHTTVQLAIETPEKIERTAEGEPMVFIHGDSTFLPSLQEELAGLEVGDEKHVVLPPPRAYGYARPDAFRAVPIDEIPLEARFVGATVAAQDLAGNRGQFRVHEVREDTVILDLNHPLAGRTLVFDVRILAIE